MTNSPHASMAPELPAETTASTAPSLARSNATRIDESFLPLAATAGWSSIRMTSDAWRTVSPSSAVGAVAGELLAHPCLVADEDDLGDALAHRRHRAFDLGSRRVVASHRVDGDGAHLQARPRSPRSS